MTTPEQCYRYLEEIGKKVRIDEMLDMANLMVGWDSGNRYLIKTKQGQAFMYAQELSNPYARNMNEQDHAFQMNIMVFGSNGMWMPFLNMYFFFESIFLN